MRSREEIGLDILRAAQTELYLQFPYLDAALGMLRPQAGRTRFAATDGQLLYYDAHYLADRYLRSATLVNRLYLHMVLHCLLRHLGRRREKQPELWDLACDIAVESILDALDAPCLYIAAPTMQREKLYGEMRAKMPVLTADGVYRELQRHPRTDYELAALARAFFSDDHSLWGGGGTEQTQRQDERWQRAAGRSQTAMDTVLAGQAAGGDAIYTQLRIVNRPQVDLRAFLRRFAAPREVMAVDGDAFDYAFYSYGLRLYGNLPLVEPLEWREDRRIDQFMIAIDTSLSTAGDLVRRFLELTCAVLFQAETFTRHVELHLVQCDDTLRSDMVVRDAHELEAALAQFTLAGGSATDFRPVFTHVADLQAQGKLTGLRGLLYLTDGMGVYPEKRPPYEAAFVLLEPPPIAVPMPPWAIRLELGEEDLERAEELR